MVKKVKTIRKTPSQHPVDRFGGGTPSVTRFTDNDDDPPGGPGGTGKKNHRQTPLLLFSDW